MSSKPPVTPDQGAKANRDARLKAALKANMARRKAQARARDTAKAGPAGQSGEKKDT
ncbi:hypothetical protein U5922_001600 [Aquicoccus sp. G2-2]|uniref:hypothetical protein n=1 Tax=Aquicoccus sp. G2-2 TaxID=3092120 RepID=UPI002ADF51E5|nr:hypothetical protein [Aquicoccus sp. G2-2]MEA1112225.1 hypothetical protein [Aquicoccus sp. G2-2]